MVNLEWFKTIRGDIFKSPEFYIRGNLFQPKKVKTVDKLSIETGFTPVRTDGHPLGAYTTGIKPATVAVVNLEWFKTIRGDIFKSPEFYIRCDLFQPKKRKKTLGKLSIETGFTPVRTDGHPLGAYPTGIKPAAVAVVNLEWF